jgi:hypothetical protein
MTIFEIMEKIRFELLLDKKQFTQLLKITTAAYSSYKEKLRNPAFYVRKRLFELSERIIL